MPDAWEYPWCAAWDLAFHAVPLAHVDPAFAKSQILILLQDRYMHPSGQLPAYEWAFGDVNPPVHAWAALRVFHCAGDHDFEFLEHVFHRLLINFTWWVNRKDSRGDNVFEGGFLGLDNPDGQRTRVRVRSLVGLLPMIATTTLGTGTLRRLPSFAADLEWFLARRPEYAEALSFTHVRDGATGQLLSMVPPDDLRRLLAVLFDEGEFLSPFGIRSLSKAHEHHPYALELPGFRAEVGYEPGESQTGVFGGNSNWRGPVWLPANVMLIQGLRRFARLFGDEFRLEFPTGSGRLLTLAEVAGELTQRLSAVFLPDGEGRRPASATRRCLATTPHGARTCCSMSTSTQTPERAWAPPTRPDGPRSSPTSCSIVMPPSTNHEDHLASALPSRGFTDAAALTG